MTEVQRSDGNLLSYSKPETQRYTLEAGKGVGGGEQGGCAQAGRAR